METKQKAMARVIRHAREIVKTIDAGITGPRRFAVLDDPKAALRKLDGGNR